MPASLEGQTLGKYRVLEPLGRGGMAQVYRAYHPQLDRYVAIKVLRSDLVEEPEFLDRFRREAQAVANLRHPNIVQVHDFDIQFDVYYMIMELLSGDTLKMRMNEYRSRGENMPLAKITRIMLDSLAGLSYAHSESLIHRDIKPANIMLTQRGQAVLTDFGIAHIVGGTQYTASGALMGTLAYMAPEQGLEGRTSPQSDIYSLGIVFYEMLTGRPPFDADTPLAILMKHVNDPLPLPRSINADIPASFERMVLRALAKSPGDRYQNADEMAQVLREAAQDAETPISEQVSDPDFTLVGVPAGAAVLSGPDRERFTNDPLVSDETNTDLIKSLTKEAEPAQQSVTGSISSNPARQTLSEPVFATDPKDLSLPKDIVKKGSKAVLPAFLALIGYNLVAVMLGLISGKWRIFEVGWPAEILLVSLGLCLLLAETGAPMLLLPTGILLGNGILMGFYSVTGWWNLWTFFWPLEPLLVLGTLGYTLWLAARGEHKEELTRGLAQNLVRITLLALLVIFVLSAIPLG